MSEIRWTRGWHERAKVEVANGAHLDRDESELALAEIERAWGEIERLTKEPGAGSHADAADDAVATVYEQDAERERTTAVPERLTREEARERLRALGVAGPDALLDDAKGWIDRIARKKSKGQIAAILRAYVAGQDADTAKGLSEPARPSAWMQREAREGVRFAEAAVAAYESATPPAANRTGEGLTPQEREELQGLCDRLSDPDNGHRPPVLRLCDLAARALSAPAAPALVFYRGDRVSHIQETPGKAWCGISLAHLEPEPDRTLDGRACKRCRALMPAALPLVREVGSLKAEIASRRATPAPLTETAWERWDALPMIQKGRTRMGLRDIIREGRGESWAGPLLSVVEAHLRASRGDIPPDVRAVKDGGGQ